MQRARTSIAELSDSLASFRACLRTPQLSRQTPQKARAERPRYTQLPPDEGAVDLGKPRGAESGTTDKHDPATVEQSRCHREPPRWLGASRLSTCAQWTSARGGANTWARRRGQVELFELATLPLYPSILRASHKCSPMKCYFYTRTPRISICTCGHQIPIGC